MARFIMASSSGMRPCMAIMYCSGSDGELKKKEKERGERERRGEERRGEERRGEERRGEERRGEERRGEEMLCRKCSVTR